MFSSWTLWRNIDKNKKLILKLKERMLMKFTFVTSISSIKLRQRRSRLNSALKLAPRPSLENLNRLRTSLPS